MLYQASLVAHYRLIDSSKEDNGLNVKSVSRNRSNTQRPFKTLPSLRLSPLVVTEPYVPLHLTDRLSRLKHSINMVLQMRTGLTFNEEGTRLNHRAFSRCREPLLELRVLILARQADDGDRTAWNLAAIEVKNLLFATASISNVRLDLLSWAGSEPRIAEIRAEGRQKRKRTREEKGTEPRNEGSVEDNEKFEKQPQLIKLRGESNGGASKRQRSVDFRRTRSETGDKHIRRAEHRPVKRRSPKALSSNQASRGMSDSNPCVIQSDHWLTSKSTRSSVEDVHPRKRSRYREKYGKLSPSVVLSFMLFLVILLWRFSSSLG